MPKKGFGGIIELNEIKQKLFQPDLFNRTSIKSIIKAPAATIYPD